MPRSPTRALTTVAPDKEFIADLAVEQLVWLMSGEAQPGGDVVAPHTIVERDST